MTYPTIWMRYLASMTDSVIVFPFGGTILEISSRYSHWIELCLGIPVALFIVYNHVYLVRRDGCSYGKRLAGMRIRRLDGSAVGYREALIRYLPFALAQASYYVARAIAFFSISAADYAAAPNKERLVDAAMPDWFWYPACASTAWLCLDVLFMLNHDKRRSLHDVIAGTVVVEEASEPTAIGQPATTTADHPSWPRA